MRSAVTFESPVCISDDRLCYEAIRALNYYLSIGIHGNFGMSVNVGTNVSIEICIRWRTPTVYPRIRHEIDA